LGVIGPLIASYRIRGRLSSARLVTKQKTSHNANKVANAFAIALTQKQA